MPELDTPDRFTQYVNQLDSLIGAKSTIDEMTPEGPEPGRVSAVYYRDIPEPGYLTGFTYGLSLSSHPAWTEASRELSLTVRSTDLEWVKAPCRMIGMVRGRLPFNRGQVIGHSGRFVERSQMNNMLLAEPAVLTTPNIIDLCPRESKPADHDLVEIIGAYPIYASERDFVYANGFDAFWKLEWDRFDPLRPPAV